MSFTSSHSSLVIVLSKHDRFVPVHACVWKYWVKITCSFSAWLAHIPSVFFYTPCFPSASVPDAVILAFGWSLLDSMGAPCLWKGISRKCRMSPQASLMPFLSLLMVINTSLLVFSGSDCVDVFSCLISYREKSLEMQNCSWVVVAEKGKMLKWKTQIRSVNMYLNWWK